MEDLKYIIDTAFLPTEITHVRTYDDYMDGLYRLVYGILHASTSSLDRVSDLVVRMSRCEENKVVKRFKLMNWKKSIDEIIKKLRKLDDKSHTIVINIPFLPCREHIETIIIRFEMASFVIKEILEKGDADMSVGDSYPYSYNDNNGDGQEPNDAEGEATQDEQEANDDEDETADDGQESSDDEDEDEVDLTYYVDHCHPYSSPYSLPSLKEFFEVFYRKTLGWALWDKNHEIFKVTDEMLKSNDDGLSNDGNSTDIDEDKTERIPRETLYKKDPIWYWSDILCDEMIRRGITSAKILGGEQELKPSMFYDDSQRFMQTFTEEINIYQLPIEEDSIPIGNSQTEEERTTMKEKVAVMFYMFEAIINDTSDRHKRIALINYALDSKEPYNIKLPKKETNNNSVRTYYDRFKNVGVDDLLAYKVVKELNACGFDVSEELNKQARRIKST